MNGVGIPTSVFLDSLERVLTVGVVFSGRGFSCFLVLLVDVHVMVCYRLKF